MTLSILRKVIVSDSIQSPGIFHLGNAGEASWHEFASEILRRRGFDSVTVTPISTDEYPTPAKRPAYSVLDKSKAAKTFGIDIPHWSDGLDRCLGEIR
jgi:dTDP-4-dehydrorhamnose reductase